IVADAAGNWLAKFPGLVLENDSFFIVVEQQAPTWNTDRDAPDNQVRTYFSTGVNSVQSKPSQLTPLQGFNEASSSGLFEDLKSSKKSPLKANLDWRVLADSTPASGMGGVE
ncbi:MAG: hypothetical protein AAF226_12630, partial [Verrucomicrobiota bacterium]